MLDEGLLTEPRRQEIFHMLGEGLLTEPLPAGLRVAHYRRIPTDKHLTTAIKRFQRNRVTIVKTSPA